MVLKGGYDHCVRVKRSREALGFTVQFEAAPGSLGSRLAAKVLNELVSFHFASIFE